MAIWEAGHPPHLLAYDLGTSGNKASLYNVQGNCINESFVAYQTYFPKSGWHEQRPEDRWSAVIESTRSLLKETNIDA
jgi:xylulokinase